MVADVDEAVEGYLSSTADPSFKRLVLLRQGIDRAVCREQIPSQVFIGRLSYRRDPVRGGGAVVIRTACERSIAMSKVVAIMSMSLDGYVADRKRWRGRSVRLVLHLGGRRNPHRRFEPHDV